MEQRKYRVQCTKIGGKLEATAPKSLPKHDDAVVTSTTDEADIRKVILCFIYTCILYAVFQVHLHQSDFTSNIGLVGKRTIL